VLQLFGGLAPFEGGVDCDFSETAGPALDEGDAATLNGGLAEVGIAIVNEHRESWPAMLKPHDVAFIRQPVKGKFHHASFVLDNWGDVLKAASLSSSLSTAKWRAKSSDAYSV
jgi:hypothetical protein